MLIGGLRVDEHSEFGTELTYQVSAAYFLPGGTKLRAALGTGFREPLWGEIFTTLWTVGNPDLDPERSMTWELGVEQRLWEDRLRLEGVFFSSRFEDLIEYNSTPPGGPVQLLQYRGGQGVRTGVFRHGHAGAGLHLRHRLYLATQRGHQRRCRHLWILRGG